MLLSSEDLKTAWMPQVCDQLLTLNNSHSLLIVYFLRCVSLWGNGRTSSGNPDTSWGEDGEHELHAGGDCFHQL